MHSIGVAEEMFDVRATAVKVTDDALIVDLEDGRTISCPLVWYPRLLHGTPAERKNVEVGAFGLHWPDLDEDLSIKGVILGWKSGENPDSIKFWLDNRKKGRKVTFEDFMRHQRTVKPPKASSRKKRTA